MCMIKITEFVCPCYVSLFASSKSNALLVNVFIAEVGHSQDNIQLLAVDPVYIDSFELDDSFADDSQHAKLDS